MSNKSIFTLIVLVILTIATLIGMEMVLPDSDRLSIPPSRQAEAAALVEKVLPTMGVYAPEDRAWDLALKLYGVPINLIKYDNDCGCESCKTKTGVSSTVER